MPETAALREAEREFRRRFGQAARAHRLRLGWTQATLAAKTGLSLKFVSRVESGAVGTSAWVAWRLAAALGAEVGALVGGAGAGLAGGRAPLPGDVARFIYLMNRAAPEDRRRVYAVVRALLKPIPAAAGGEPSSFKVPRPRGPRGGGERAPR
ncbi:MAG TPA: helix-turn-helix transcriptional regulator [Myxococcota bacterium]|nr:helix-turn-helix transcriptional regulator [Myxococcota bacterium]